MSNYAAFSLLGSKLELSLMMLINPMCKFFKQPRDPIGAQEPDLAN